MMRNILLDLKQEQFIKAILGIKSLIAFFILCISQSLSAISINDMINPENGHSIYLQYDGSQWSYAIPKDMEKPTVYTPFPGNTITGNDPTMTIRVQALSHAELNFNNAIFSNLTNEIGSNLVLRGDFTAGIFNRGILEIISGNINTDVSNVNSLTITGGHIQMKSTGSSALSNSEEGTCIISGNAKVNVISEKRGPAIWNQGKFYIKENAKVSCVGGCSTSLKTGHPSGLGFFIEGGEFSSQGITNGISFDEVNGFSSSGDFIMTGGSVHFKAGSWTSDPTKSSLDAYGFQGGSIVQILGGTLYAEGPSDISYSKGSVIFSNATFEVGTDAKVIFKGGDRALLSTGLCFYENSKWDIKGTVIVQGGSDSQYSYGINYEDSHVIPTLKLSEGRILAYGETAALGCIYFWGNLKKGDWDNVWKEGRFLQWKLPSGEFLEDGVSYTVYEKDSEEEILTFTGTPETKNITSFGTNLPVGEYILKKTDKEGTIQQMGVFSQEESSSNAKDLDDDEKTFSVCENSISTYVDIRDAKVARSVTYKLKNLTTDGKTTIDDGEYLSFTLSPIDNYKLPSSIVITMGEILLDESVDYEYDKEIGEVRVICAVTGDVVVEASGVNDPSVIESEFTLLKEGNGEFKATYTYLEDETDPESIITGTIYADTTYTVINQEQFKITATPAEGSELVKVVHIQNGKETELPDIQPGVEFDYNIVVADTLKAYFKEKGIPSSSCELSGDQDYTLTYTQDAGWSYTTPGNETPVYFTDTICGSTTGSVTVIIPESEYTLVFQNCSVDSLNVKSNAGALWVDGNVIANVATGNIHMKSGSLIQAPEGKGVVTLTEPTEGGSYTAFAFAQTFETGRRLPVGTNVSFRITPEEGYEVESALFGKVSMMDTFAENMVNHTITESDTDLTVTITFKKVEVVSTPLDLTQVTDTVTVSYENNNWYYQETGKEKVVFTGEVTGTNNTVVLLAEDIPTDAPALQFAENSEVGSLVVSEGSALQVEGSVTVGSVSGNIKVEEDTKIKPANAADLQKLNLEEDNQDQDGGFYNVFAFGKELEGGETLPIGTVLTFNISVEDGYELESAKIGEVDLSKEEPLLRTRAVSTTVKRYYEITGKESNLKVEITFRKTNTDEPEDPDTPPVDPVKYYNIYKESICDGVNVSFSKNPVKEGGSISIKVEKDEENYTFENFKVWYKEGYYGNWEELKESTQPGEYKIQNIWNHIYVKAEGSAKKNPTGIEEVEGVKVYTKDGSLFVQTLQREQVIVISMTGAVVKNEEQIGLKQYHGLNPGIYIVRIGEQVFKIRI